MPMRRQSNGHGIDSCNTIDVQVFNLNVVTLLDTGASCSCISKTFFFIDRLKLRILPIQRNDAPLTLHAANGNVLQIAGQIQISVKIGGCHMPHTFIVLPQLHQHLILRWDFIASTHAVIDLNKNFVIFYDELLAAPINSQSGHQNILRTSTDTVLPP